MKYEYWINNIEGIGFQKRKILYGKDRTAKEIYELTDKELSCIEKLTVKDIQRITQSKKSWDLDAELEDLRRKKIKFISRQDDQYPEKLKKIADAPHALYLKGNLPDENQFAAAIVGARCCSQYGIAFAKEIAAELADCGVSVISGMARGIDSWGHMGAIEVSRPTYAVLGCGVDVCYPAENQELYDQILQCGGLISEYPPGTSPLPGLFPARNRIISGLSDIVIVIEARERSGSLITADYALEQGKDIYALPGRTTDSLSGGCNRLIKQGAGIILSAKDLLLDLQIQTQKKEKSKNINKNVLEKQQMVVYSETDLQPVSLDEIMERTGMTLSDTVTVLMQLQKEGYIKEVFKNYYVRI